MEVQRALALRFHRNLSFQQSRVDKAIERLSSGLRLNRAADDAAGLSISETLTAQMRGTHQAVRNSQDGIALVRTAEGAFASIHDVLQRMRELTLQGGNTTLGDADRLAIQAELEMLKRQIDTTAAMCEFNGQRLLVSEDRPPRDTPLSYTYLGSADAALAAAPGNTIGGVTLEELEAAKAQLPYLLEGAWRKAEALLLNSGEVDVKNGNAVRFDFVIDTTNPRFFSAAEWYVPPSTLKLEVNLYALFGSGLPAGNPEVTLAQAIAQAAGHGLMIREDQFGPDTADPNDYFQYGLAPLGNPYNAVRFFASMGASESYLGYGKPPAGFTFSRVLPDGNKQDAGWFYQYLLENHGLEATRQVAALIVESGAGGAGAIYAALDTYLTELTGLSKPALEAAVDAWIQDPARPTPTPVTGLANTGPALATPLARTLVLQVGANQGEVLELELFGGALGALDFAGAANVMTLEAAGRSLETLDRAIAIVSDARTRLGATERRLEHTVSRLGTAQEALLSARSQIRDTDMAAEVTEQTRAEMLASAATFVLRSHQRIAAEQTERLIRGN